MQDDKNNLQRKSKQSKNKQSKSKQTTNPVLTEKDFYPPKDDRYLISGVEDIRGGDNFADYTEYYFGTYFEED